MKFLGIRSWKDPFCSMTTTWNQGTGCYWYLRDETCITPVSAPYYPSTTGLKAMERIPPKSLHPCRTKCDAFTNSCCSLRWRKIAGYPIQDLVLFVLTLSNGPRGDLHGCCFLDAKAAPQTLQGQKAAPPAKTYRAVLRQRFFLPLTVLRILRSPPQKFNKGIKASKILSQFCYSEL